ncbi:tRNA (guanosine(46)-N7)-methyltransferase TrmB [Ktedonosporobacter rubrisoli]|uniref:tRNA (guanine-N(7)-)-methyltransferase n=1 Tax=Ktedonosporobacter rubrisoli TaxID=2509675 RepID=A0A4P6K5J8_KTERU|nr:tRNA (guanosine(46)-N7)-methyltransferase TrmB [Ktedonosporobacter rubrisoli]QBD83272.1 tRNA (guanosine(46)-N7)-methyltransferase TrmB [Ktedonosporobacter rubrisoli]
MPRRTFLRFTRAQLLDQELITRYLLSLSPEQLHRDSSVFPKMASRPFFGNDAPLELEVGCGSAEQLCHLAHQLPGCNFIGVDIARKSLEKAIELAARLELSNIKFLHADFQHMTPLLIPQSLQAVYLHFPDPHLKPKCRKRRIFNQAFLDTLDSTLVPSGTLSVMTDVEEFFLDMLQIIEADPRFIKTHPERYLIGFSGTVRSHFQRLWEDYGETIYRFEYRKR